MARIYLLLEAVYLIILIYRWWYVKSGLCIYVMNLSTDVHSNAGCGNCSRGPSLLITVQVKQEIKMTWNRKFILLCEPGCVSSDHSLLISVLFHLIETFAHTHTHTHGTCRPWAPGVRRMDHFFYASFQVTAAFKRSPCSRDFLEKDAWGWLFQIHILSSLLFVNMYILYTCMSVLYICMLSSGTCMI